MDKYFLLTYTCNGYDGFRHSHHAWFANEDHMKQFVKEHTEKDHSFEIDLAIEILSHREIRITS